MKKSIFFKSTISFFVFLFVCGNIYGITHVVSMQSAHNTNQHFCLTSYPNDTVILYTGSFCSPGITQWQINFGPVVAVGDSLIYVPTGPGFVTISSMCGATLYTFLNFYSEPPANANFTISGGGGYVNATNDTVWMCGNSVSVSSNTIGGEATSYHWYGPGGFYNTSNDPVIFSVPGMYYFERPNPCGITRDTFALVQPALMSPVWPSDTSFCNLPVSLTLDAGPGWFVYDWSTGETTQTIDVTAAGSYSVQLANICTSGGATIVVEEQNYPLPDLYLYSTIPGTGMLCHYDTATLVPHDMHLYDTYQWYQGMGLTPISNQATLLVDYILGSNYYAVEVSQGGCTANADIGIGFYENPWDPELCVATYDPFLGKNKIVFSHIPMPEDVEYILAYRQGANWVGIDTISVSEPEQILYDNINDPNQQSQTYAVFARHQCGHLSLLSDWHKTIRIGLFQDVGSGDYILQILDDYETLSGYIPTSYTIWIDSLNNENFFQIGTLQGGNQSFTISAPVIGAAYYASVNLPWNCDSKTNAVAFSNKRNFGTIDVPEFVSEQIIIYPNPSDGIFHIQGNQISYVEVVDILGNVIITTNSASVLDLSGYSGGVYIAHIQSAQGSTIIKLILK